MASREAFYCPLWASKGAPTSQKGPNGLLGSPLDILRGLYGFLKCHFEPPEDAMGLKRAIRGPLLDYR